MRTGPEKSIANLDAEQSVLGAILLRPEALVQVADLLTPQDFYREDNRRIFQAFLDLKSQGAPVDLVTVTTHLRDKGELEKIGGPVFLAELSEHVGTAANVAYYTRLVRNKAVVRRLQASCQEIASACLQHQDSGAVADLLTFAESKILEITKSDGLRPEIDIEKAIPDIGEFLKLETPARRVYLHPWLKEASINMISGWRGVGKTKFALSLLNAVSRGEAFGPWAAGDAVGCLYFDAEMVQQDLKARCEEIHEPGRQRQTLRIFSDHYCNLLGMPSGNLLDEKWRRWMREVLLKLGVKLWVLDNLGPLTPGINESSSEDWSPINRWLLDLRFLGVASILIHQEGKSGTQRGTTAREDNLDISISLKKPKGYRPEEGARFILRFEKARVPQQDLHLIADCEFKEQKDPQGKPVWVFSGLKTENKARVLSMLDEGIAAKDIAQLVGISEGRVSQIKAKADKEGFINREGKLTQSGILYVQRELNQG